VLLNSKVNIKLKGPSKGLTSLLSTTNPGTDGSKGVALPSYVNITLNLPVAISFESSIDSIPKIP